MLVRWVHEGAHDPRIVEQEDPTDWWSLKPMNPPDIPPDQHLIDVLVQRRLEQAGLAMSPEADRRTLLKRLTVDLHGLPATPEAVETFINDSSPDAYEKQVDALLASPRYGERWARHWLDTIHFADSHGCEHDVLRPNAWRFRDYVINRLNQDTPWPRFIREQLAADVFFPDESNLTAALGFIGAGPLELSRAGTAPVTFDYLDRDDMVTQTMSAFASATVNCARCHNHKFDPITQEDYYAMQAVFAGIGKGDVEYDADPSTGRERNRWQNVLTAIKSYNHEALTHPEYAALVADKEKKIGNRVVTWRPLNASVFLTTDGSTLKKLDDGSLLATGTNPDKETYTVTATPGPGRMTAIRLHVMSHDSLPQKGPGRAGNGNLHLTE
ncbi:MAG: DUF1549 domain-containing protein, partial [Verrucomicrobiota bacterium]